MNPGNKGIRLGRCGATMLFAVAVCAGGALIFPSMAWATEYTFTNIIDSTNPLFGDYHGIDINNNGTVAIGIADAFSVHASAIYTWSGGPLTVIVDTTDNFKLYGPPNINDAGIVAFVGVRNNGNQGLFVSDGVSITTLVPSNNTMFDSLGLQKPAFNNEGVAAFTAIVSTNPTTYGLYSTSGGPLTTIVEPTTDGLSEPAINNEGAIAYAINHHTPTSPEVLRWQDGIVTTIADESGTGEDNTFRYVKFPDINDNGMVAFNAMGNIECIYTGDGGPLTPWPAREVFLTI